MQLPQILRKRNPYYHIWMHKDYLLKIKLQNRGPVTSQQLLLSKNTIADLCKHSFKPLETFCVFK